MGYRSELKFENLQVTAYLRTPVVCDPQFPLDAILLYQASWLRKGYREFSFPGEYNRNGGVTLPLAIEHYKTEDWYYKCSFAEWGLFVDDLLHWNKRIDDRYIQFMQPRKVDRQRGVYRAYHMPLFCRSALYVRWYCVGDKSEIEMLLSTAKFIGKKTAQGYGSVIRWEVIVIDQDYSVWKDGKLMRAIPIADKPSGFVGRITTYGIRPSYWYKNNWRMVVLPA